MKTEQLKIIIELLLQMDYIRIKVDENQRVLEILAKRLKVKNEHRI